MISGIEHVAILSKNTEKLKDWYIKMLDFKQVFENKDKTYFLMADDGGMIEFVMAAEDGGKYGTKASGIRHLALTTKTIADFDETVALLKNSKVEIVLEPATTATGVKTFFFKDPEENILHLIYRPVPFKIQG
jgi:glyoxylase I family protein